MEWQSCHFCSSAVVILSLYSFHHFQMWNIFAQHLHRSIFNLYVKIDHFFPLVGRIHHLFQVTLASCASVNYLAEWRGICCICAVTGNYFCSSCKWKHQPDVTALLHSTIQTCNKFVFREHLRLQMWVCVAYMRCLSLAASLILPYCQCWHKAYPHTSWVTQITLSLTFELMCFFSELG